MLIHRSLYTEVHLNVTTVEEAKTARWTLVRSVPKLLRRHPEAVVLRLLGYPERSWNLGWTENCSRWIGTSMTTEQGLCPEGNHGRRCHHR
ncbi:hypothetical protein M758_UG069700 [Ceratodon purpureus]|nr:hypothetical protein M758_UG069700 [Ceratodon purpureus]